jgi:hypothetical protein
MLDVVSPYDGKYLLNHFHLSRVLVFAEDDEWGIGGLASERMEWFRLYPN